MRYLIILSGILLTSVSLFIYFGRANPPAHPIVDGYKFLKKNCWFDVPWPSSVTCGELHTPVSSGHFVLSVAILHNNSATERPDPILYLQGGPGAAARIHEEGIKSWFNWMSYTNTGRDLILFDSRGVGRSSPALTCAAFNNFNYELLTKNLSLENELAQGYGITEQCFSDLRRKNSSIDAKFFGSQLSAQDIRALMAQLNYNEWNILAVSYGTRLALEIARQEVLQPQQVRLKSIVLDSVYPAGYGGIQTWPEVLDKAMRQFFVGCAASSVCSSQLASISAEKLTTRFLAALKKLKNQPMELTIRRWDGEAPIKFLVNDHRFLSAVFAAIYETHDWPKIVTALVAVEENNSDQLKPIIEPYLNHSLNADFNSLTFMAVDCADNPILAESDYQQSVNQFPLFSEYTESQWRYQICHELSPREHGPKLELTEPQIPTLLIAGALDPITPLTWAHELKNRWPRVQLLVRNNSAHSVLSEDSCLLSYLSEYFDAPEREFSRCIDNGDAL